MKIEYSKNLEKIPPYPFVEMAKKKKAKLAAGADIVDLGIGDPDLPTPEGIINAMNDAIRDSSTHRYPMDAGRQDFREAWAKWAKKRFGISLNPEKEVQALIGSKEGLCNITRAFVNVGDKVLVPDPGYPGYKNGAVTLTGGIPIFMPLLEENSFLPELDKIDNADAKAAKMIFVNYPNNPTGAVAGKDFYKELIDFAQDNNIIVVSDNAYSEIYFDEKPLSIFEIEGAMDVAIELASFSKTYNMTGWRLATAYGNAEIVGGLSKVKENIDSGVFEAIQVAGIYALENYDEAPAMSEYEKRMDALVDAFKKADIEADKPPATFYLWAKTPEGTGSVDFVNRVMEEANVVLTPGTAFGPHGEGYFRASITSPTKRIYEAAERISKLDI